MAGVVAMASVIEDFDTQPCKKSRKDGGSPVVKTITNYFSPVPKPVEKPFSPPRPNSIRDYFSQKPPSSKEKTGSPEPSKENGPRSRDSAEKHASPEVAAKPPCQKRRRKANKTARKLVEAETSGPTEEESCDVLVLGSDTERKTAKDDASKSRTEPNQSTAAALSPVLPSHDKNKPVKTTARNPRRNRQQEAKPSEEEKETEKRDASVEEASPLNTSTVTISFEEFVRSQSQEQEDEEEPLEECKLPAEVEETGVNQLGITKGEENGEATLQISPRTLTIQAEVHVVKPTGKVASIFNRRRGPASPPAPPPAEAGQRLPSPSAVVKRRSNVVLQEEDLELAVLDSEATPKCSEAEKKLFMAAFKQPAANPDGTRTKPGKNQGKMKQPGEKVADAAEEDATILPPPAAAAAAAAAETQEKKEDKKKPARKGRKNPGVATSAAAAAAAAAAAEEQEVIIIHDKKEEPPITSAVRRSRREVVVRQTSTTPTNTRKRDSLNPTLKEAAAGTSVDTPADTSLITSTPRTRRSRHGVFVAEMLCPPDKKGSPIRIKFTRVHKNLQVAKNESGTNKASSDSKKRTMAKKLVEKAIAIQKSKKTAAETKNSLRRSSRTEASISRSYCEDEDSVICLEEDQPAAPGRSKTQKNLRSLNEVLGKTGKGSKAASLGQEKVARRPAAVISIFDESSREDSENSQDDERFRARREFLKSGLPESFRKQIAKTAATKEAYSRSCSSFQPVTHSRQTPNGCCLWNLPWPESSLLRHLNQLWSQTPDLPLTVTVGGSFCLKTEPDRRGFDERGSGWRPEISERVRQLLVDEVAASNPDFPLQTFIPRFLKRKAEQQQQQQQQQQHVTEAAARVPDGSAVGGKRKRSNDDEESTAKKQRSEEKTSTSETARRGRTRRGRKTKKEEEKKSVAMTSGDDSLEDDVLLVEDDVLLVEDAEKKVCSTDVVKEDLWTDKYQPQHSSDILGNTSSVRKLHSWLKEWKLRADREERNKQRDKREEEGSNDSDWERGEDDVQDGDDMLCNTLLITGPTGVGKTAAVYACAQELGFKVFEVNSSSQRSGRLILSQLKEATQSHQVDSQGVNATKPTYFTSYSSSSSSGPVRVGSSPRKVNSPRRVVSSPRKHPQSPRGSKRGGLAPTSLANFFKMSRPASKEPANTKKNEQKAASKKITNEGANKQKEAAAAAKEKSQDEQNKKSATSLILFEEVDVIFDDDSGFLAAIKTFMSTTKRPVVLTTSDPTFSTMFDGNFEEIHFNAPSVVDSTSFLQLLCLSEDVRTNPSDLGSLLRINGCDIRQSLLQLQFWSRSSGGRHRDAALQSTDELQLEPAGESTASFPPRESGCTESLLGLMNIRDTDVWDIIRSPNLQAEWCWDLLKESSRQGVGLLYSNMETLLPLPTTPLTALPSPDVPVAASHDLPAAAGRLRSDSGSEDSSPVKVSSRMKRSQRRHRLPHQDQLDSDSDSEERFLSLNKPQDAASNAAAASERLVSLRMKPLTPEQRVKNPPVSLCLESIAGFLDDMSYVDSSLLRLDAGGVSPAVKDGMTDEAREDMDASSWARMEQRLELGAAVEALSFNRCRSVVSDAWDAAQKLDGVLGEEAAAKLRLPLAKHQEGCSFTQDGPCPPQLQQQRKDVLERLLLTGVCGFLGNRTAAAADYLPTLRNICRSQQLKEQEKTKRRFLHYLDAVHLGLDKTTLQQLAGQFP